MTIPTPKQLVTEWVAALRSGEYKQGRDVLHNEKDDTYCCLGVACDVLVKKGFLTEESMTHTIFRPEGEVSILVTNYRGDDGDANDQLLPQSACRLLGLAEWETDDFEGERHDYEAFVEDPEFEVELTDPDGVLTHAHRAVSSLNDTYHFTFEQIADLIEAQILNKME